MFTLIKREIYDNILYYIGALIASGGGIVMVASHPIFSSSNPGAIAVPPRMYEAVLFLTPILSILSAVLGAIQTSMDMEKKIPAFLSTLTVTRSWIFLAKIIAGILYIAAAFVPLLVGYVLLTVLFLEQLPADMVLLLKVFSVCMLSCLVCYSIGLYMGWSKNKHLRLLSTIAIIPIVLSIMVIKGIGISTVIILLLFSVLMIFRAWQRFMSTSL